MSVRTTNLRSPRRGRATAGFLAALLLPVLTACASTSAFEQHYDAGRYSEALRTFEQNPESLEGERALFRSGVLYLTSEGEDHDIDRARRQFERLLTRFPDTRYRAQVNGYLSMLDRVDSLESHVAERKSEADSLRSEVRRLENRSGWLQAALIGREAQAELLRLSTERLRDTLREMEDEIAGLREELERLKEIDLQPSG